jgi:hypothetical protein
LIGITSSCGHFLCSQRLPTLRKKFETKTLELAPEDIAAGGLPSEVVESKGKEITEGAIYDEAPEVRGYEMKI